MSSLALRLLQWPPAAVVRTLAGSQLRRAYCLNNLCSAALNSPLPHLMVAEDDQRIISLRLRLQVFDLFLSFTF